MLLWRIEYSQHIEDCLTGEGARRYGGRWNRKGTPVVYLSSSLSLAAFEKFVHAQPADNDVALYAVSVEIPDELTKHAARPKPLPRGWRSPGPDPETMLWGSSWATSRASLVAALPSTLLPLKCFELMAEFNLMLNPEHPDMKQVRAPGRTPYAFDPRMWKGRAFDSTA
jgi:RES domain-containing protein